MLGLDDGIAALAQVFAYGNALSVIIALRNGLAQSSPDHEADGDESNLEKVSKARMRPSRSIPVRLTKLGHPCKHCVLPSGISYG